MKRNEIETLKRHLISILETAGFNHPVKKIHLTLKEGNIGPNIKIFFDDPNGIDKDYIFLSEYRNEKTEDELFQLLSEAKNIRELGEISPRILQDIAYLI